MKRTGLGATGGSHDFHLRAAMPPFCGERTPPPLSKSHSTGSAACQLPRPKTIVSAHAPAKYAGEMIDPGLAAVFASVVSLALGLASIVRASSDARKTAMREQIQRRAEAYVELLRVVERRGLAVQDDMYNLTETEQDDFPITIRRRKIDAPPRSDRAEALALVTAYGTPAIRNSLDSWINAVDAWESKKDDFDFEHQLNGPSTLQPKDAEPERANEIAARGVLGESISLALN